jgi:hypothetical protein
MIIHKKHSENIFKDCVLSIGMNEAVSIGGLSKTSIRLYLFLREHAFRTNGYLIIDFELAKQLCQYKQNKSVYNALNELVSNNILAKSKDSIEFYYNPKFISHEKE